MFRLTGFLFGAILLTISGELSLLRAAPSPAYLLAFRGGHELHTMLPDGTGIRRITEMPGIEMHPSWSPDGRWITFVSYRTFMDGDKEIYRVRPGGGQLERLTHNETWDFYALWSPDSEKIAFLSDEFLLQFFILNVKEKAKIQIDDMIGVRDFSWSPDGRWLALLAGEGGRPYLIHPDGSEKRLLLDETHRLITSNLVWSPDSEWLAFGQYVDSYSQIFRVRADGSQVERLTNGEIHHLDPLWSPDGNWLVYTQVRSFEQQIFKMQADGRNPQAVSSPLSNIEKIVWSPDGKWLYFLGSLGSYGQPGQIYRVSADGQKQERLTHTANELESPAVSPLIDLRWRAWIVFLTGFILMAVHTKIVQLAVKFYS